MGETNREWHLKNRMPPRATFEQRVTWHREHLKHCACRADLPADIKKALGEKTIGI
jgi:hypothetical protein